MFQVNDACRNIMERLNLSYRIKMTGGTVMTEPMTDKEGKVIMLPDGKPRMRAVKDENDLPIVEGGKTIAEIIDLDTGQAYIEAEGHSAQDAVEAGLALAAKTPKPRTRAQQLADEGAAAAAGAAISAAVSDAVSAKDAEIEKLKKQLAKLEAKAKRQESDTTPASAPVPGDPTPEPTTDDSDPSLAEFEPDPESAPTPPPGRRPRGSRN